MIIKPPTARLQSRMLIGAAILASIGLAPQVFAQQATSLEEVIVTATKRDEMLQDVPVAVTPVTQAMIETNQIKNVGDLGSMAPNLSVRPSAGGINLPTFNMRGITSYGVVAGSDKQISIYLDGVYIGAPRGQMFNLPDIQQLEVLRGPQGTLFGRNATGGAISITTRSPSGELGFRQKVTAGSRDLLTTETTIDSPTMGPLSLYFTYAQTEQDGDVKNLGAGTTWNRSAFGGGIHSSPKTLGSKDTETYFLAALLELSDDFSLSYKFDYGTDEGSPEAQAIVGNWFPAAIPSATITAVTAENAAGQFGNYSRPNAVNNAWSLYRDQTVEGHNLTATWDINSDISLKNIAAYRKLEINSVADVSAGTGWLVGPLTSATTGGFVPVGTPFSIAGVQSESDGYHWSDELQFNYDADFATIVAGLMYYESSDTSGGPRNTIPTPRFAIFPNHVIPAGNQGISYNDAKSYAAYSQVDYHLNDAIDLIAGLRWTKDEKDGDWVTGNDAIGLRHEKFDYEDDKISYLVGANYHVSEDILVYAKYATAYVSGGAVSVFAFDPEEVASFEIGSKAEFLDGRLRTNIALFDAEYDHLQTAQGATLVPGAPARNLSTLVVDGGSLDAQGVELEVTALPMAGLTLSATLGYQDVEYSKVTDLNGAVAGASPAFPITYIPGSSLDNFNPTLSPEWSGNLSANYETEPVFGNSFMVLSVTGAWHDKIRVDPNPVRAQRYNIEYTPETWMVNARAALKDIELTQDWKAEVAVWARNLLDDDSMTFVSNNQTYNSSTFVEERTYGVDLIVKY